MNNINTSSEQLVDSDVVSPKDPQPGFVSKFGKRAIGLLCLAGVIVLWVGSSILMQFIFTEQSFNKPLFITYFDISTFSLYLFGFVLFRRSWLSPQMRGPAQTKISWKSDTNYKLLGDSTNNDGVRREVSQYNIRQVFVIAAIFGPIWFIDNYTFNLSLTLTSVSSNTILSSTSALFTLFLTSLCGVEKFEWVKLIGVVMTLGGVVMVSLNDTKNDGKDTMWGDLLALLSSMTYAIYATLFRRVVKNEEQMHNSMFLGFMGLVNTIGLWPLLLLWSLTGAERFEFPKGEALGYLFVNSVLGTALSDYLWLNAILFISPTICTVGLSLTIPVAMISDMVIKGSHFSALYILGSIFVAIGFVIVNLEWQKVRTLFTRSQ